MQSSDQNSGNQYYSGNNMPFSNTNMSNGMPKFPPPFLPKSSASAMMGSGEREGPNAESSFSSGLLTSQLLTSDHFSGAAMSSMQQTLTGFRGGMSQGPNLNIEEFVPKGNSPLVLTHSSSSPSFASYGSAFGGRAPSNMKNGMPGQLPALSQLSQFPNLTAATNKLHSPNAAASPSLSPEMSTRNAQQNESQISAGGTVPNSSVSIEASLMAASQTLQENVGGTTYFYTEEEMNSTYRGVITPSFSVYPGILPHVVNLEPKANMPTFFVADELKAEILMRHNLTLLQIDPEQNPDIPQEVDNYHGLFPLQSTPAQKSNTFGYQTSVYKAVNVKDGLVYCLRRIHGFRLVNTQCMVVVDLWKKIQHSNIVQMREVFTTKAFGDHSMVFVYDYHPGAETLMARHLGQPPPPLHPGAPPPVAGGFFADGQPQRMFNANGPHARPFNPVAAPPRALFPENLIWSYVIQLSSALRTIHSHGLACRVLDPTKVVITDKSRVRLNCLGIFDVLSFDTTQGSPQQMMAHYQQEDLVSLGRVILALANNSVATLQRDNLQVAIEFVARSYSNDLKNLLCYLLLTPHRVKNGNDIMPLIGARFYTQLDGAQMRHDMLESELGKEVENGRLLRLITKLGCINERPELHLDTTWSETGDRYMLKLFRDYVFHQADENGIPWTDMGHIVSCLNKLDAGVPEKICLVSRDEQTVLIVSYAELKKCFENAFTELMHPTSSAI